MSFDQFRRQVIMPIAMPLVAVAVTGILIILIGETLLNLNKPDREEWQRVELWVATGLALAIIGVSAFLMSRPEGSLGPLDEPLAIGDRPMLEPGMPPVDETARSGPEGTIADLAPGYVLYARNGALAKVNEIVRNTLESDGVRRTLIYSEGLYGAEDELWIPADAVTAVYPETQSAFLAVAGDETVALGWNRPPASFSRIPVKEEAKLY